MDGKEGKRALKIQLGLVCIYTGQSTRQDLLFEGQKRIAWGDMGIWLFHGQVALRNDFLESIYIALSAHH